MGEEETSGIEKEVARRVDYQCPLLDRADVTRSIDEVGPGGTCYPQRKGEQGQNTTLKQG